MKEGRRGALTPKGETMLLQEFNWKKEVLESPEPVLVDFWASWCPPCRTMEPVVQALARDFKVCKVNVDNNQELAVKYAVSSIPALLIFKDGNLAVRHVGITPEATLRTELEQLRDGGSPLKDGS